MTPAPTTEARPAAALDRLAWRPLLFASGIYGLLAVAGILLSHQPGSTAVFWPANAAVVGLALRQAAPRPSLALLLAVGATAFAANAAMGTGIALALGFAGCNAFEIALALALIARLPPSGDPNLGEIPALAITAVVAPMVSGIAAAGLMSVLAAPGFWHHWWVWWTASALGAVIVLPIAFTWGTALLPEQRRWPRLAELALIGGGTLAFSWQIATSSAAPFLLLSLALLLAATRLTRLAGALLSAACTLVVLLVKGSGHLSAAGAGGEWMLVQLQLPAIVSLALPFIVALLLDGDRRRLRQLAESERRFHGAMADAAIGMALVAPDGILQKVNHALCEMLGRDAANLVGRHFRDITHPDDIADDLENVRRVISGEIDSYRIEKRYITGDGRAVWGHLSVTAMRDEDTGAPVQLIAQIENIDQRKKVEQALAAVESRWSFALESARQGVWDRDVAAGRTYYSPVWKAMLGYADTEISGESAEWLRLIHPDDLPRAIALDDACINGASDTFESEFRMRHRDGHWVWVLDRGRVVNRSPDGKALRMIGTHADISLRKTAEQELRALTTALFEEKERLRITLDSIGDAVICTDTAGRVTFMNPVAEQLTGWARHEAAGLAIRDVFRVVDGTSGRALACPVEACLRSLKPHYMNEDTCVLSRRGEQLSVHDSAAPIRDQDGNVLGAVLVFQDLTGARALQAELAQSALVDALTGLPNRKALEARLAEAVDSARAGNGRFSLCFLDLDRFKILNDSAGHVAGDALLVTVAETIVKAARPGDFIARLGGDEFALLLAGIGPDEAEQIARAVIKAIADLQFTWQGRAHALTMSGGLADLPAGGLPPGEWMSRADVASYAAKSTGRNRVCVYRQDAGDAGRYHREIQVASGLRTAIVEDRFRLFAQRIEILHNVDAGKRYYEILLRLEDEEGRLMLPGSFIPAAERYDLMGEIDRWVIRTTLRRYGAPLRSLGDFALAINLSANSLNDPALWSFVEGELAASEIEPWRLHFEITETALIDNMAAASGFVAAARQAGCGITLDDFGAGLSSFSYLRQFPVDILKIDGNFIRQILNSPVDRAIVESINDLGHKFGARTIAEFVEDAAALDLLRAMGVDMAQGYAIARPVPIEAIFPAQPSA
ncbi:EAL domain-containing protein [Zavarzinia compransoris]|uniref:EAL domain-containing protein n=1 Tax=Zavarzinia compransoris TaxID=1264899 RepID=UPI00106011F0|nr:EAL domain-containing protein [Zavarzinia compransoris]TDP45961.1 PAS domain S-box-containing protein/diguanylate cyclase (GGDEF)-like protein [Zavarzinia compransoris]